MRLTFDDLFAADPRALATYPLRGKDFYAMTACIEEDGKGADLAVFGPENVRATTKLVFEAKRRADEVAIKAPGILPAAGAEVRPALCSAIGFKRNDNAPDAPFGGYPIQAPGRETAMYLGAEATIAQEVKTWMKIRADRGEALDAKTARGAFTFGLEVPRVPRSESSIDCDEASTPAELKVCSVPALRRLNERLAELYQQKLRWATREVWRAARRAELKARDRCGGSAQCLKRFYLQYIKIEQSNLANFRRAEDQRQQEEEQSTLIGPTFEDTRYTGAMLEKQDFPGTSRSASSRESSSASCWRAASKRNPQDTSPPIGTRGAIIRRPALGCTKARRSGFRPAGVLTLRRLYQSASATCTVRRAGRRTCRSSAAAMMTRSHRSAGRPSSF